MTLAAFVVGTFAAIGATLAIIVVTTARPDQADVEASAGRLHVRAKGMMRLWALSTGIDVDATSVTAVRVVERTRPQGFRAPGAYFPGVIAAGTFRNKGARSLWLVGRAKRVLTLELVGAPYQRVVVEVVDPDGTASHLQRELGLPSA